MVLMWLDMELCMLQIGIGKGFNTRPTWERNWKLQSVEIEFEYEYRLFGKVSWMKLGEIKPNNPSFYRKHVEKVIKVGKMIYCIGPPI
jgi:hypothetical protein